MKILQFVSVPEDESASKPVTVGPSNTIVTKSNLLYTAEYFLYEFHEKIPFQNPLQNLQLSQQHQANK